MFWLREYWKQCHSILYHKNHIKTPSSIFLTYTNLKTTNEYFLANNILRIPGQRFVIALAPSGLRHPIQLLTEFMSNLIKLSFPFT